ncbi:hypothetical protein [Serratia marcescens]|uniref:hypothetical protein n=1 Tax=Serratia marcescens TaxID=615 RepID=UPI0027E47398|nr:hypothetical protein [Serratia marcescens]
MTNKLSELSKPVMYVVRTLDGSVASVKSHSYTAPKGFTSEPLYSQEYVSALLAELEAKSLECRGVQQERELFRVERIAHQQYAQELEQRVAELSELETRNQCLIKKNADLTQQNIKLGERLATPVRLPDMRQSASGDRYQWSDGAHNYRLDVISMLLGAGFTVAVEGDE